MNRDKTSCEILNRIYFEEIEAICGTETFKASD